MSKKIKEVIETDPKRLEIDEVIEPTDNFDVSILKKDIENAEKEAKEAYEQDLIKKANFQKTEENFQEEKKKEIEEEETEFSEDLKDAIDFVFDFVNREIDKVGVSKLDEQFTSDLVDKLLKLIPNNQLEKVKTFLGASGKKGSTKRLFKFIGFLKFITQAIMNRVDEYAAYRKANPKQPKVKSLPEKIGDQVTQP